jgi:hypothetical protein
MAPPEGEMGTAMLDGSYRSAQPTADLDEQGIVLREQNVLVEVSKYKGRK